ncbi:MAG TPA: hypothetical protein VKX46_05780 [Ktedonobacteraceae bacterium]|jgi:hypothetical protein|nr:hypothetical protein [Ktedonobacteraceae bacterium]
MRYPVYVTDPYREVCCACGQRRQVVALHFQTDPGAGVASVRSTRLCRLCAADLARKLSAMLPFLLYLEDSR